MELSEKLLEVSRAFRIEGEFLGYETIQVGNVNHTYKVNFRMEEGVEKAFLIQNVNTYAFRDPVGLMENIDKVTQHIRSKRPGRIALHFHHTLGRKTYLAEGGNFWRMTNYIPSVTFGSAADLKVLRSAGRAFGEFQMDLADFDSGALIETIPGFHDTPGRYRQLEQAIVANRVGRRSSVQPEMEQLMAFREKACYLAQLRQQGKLPLRVTHNDTKINNVLFDRETREALVVIDLDTVMPGLIAHDFGDAIRFVANYVEEDCPELDKVGVDLEVFRAFAQGFLEKTALTMTRTELDTLALGCFVMTVEVAVRFLADYLDGDLYFKTRSEDHNLIRARNQIALATDLLTKQPQMEEILRDCAAQYR